MTGFDGVHMETAGTGQAINGVHREATTFHEAWERGKKTISELEGHLGLGPLGKVFRSSYNTSARKLIRQVDDWPSNLKYAARAGYQGVLDYQQGDQNARRGFPGGK